MQPLFGRVVQYSRKLENNVATGLVYTFLWDFLACCFVWEGDFINTDGMFVEETICYLQLIYVYYSNMYVILSFQKKLRSYAYCYQCWFIVLFSETVFKIILV